MSQHLIFNQVYYIILLKHDFFLNFSKSLGIFSHSLNEALVLDLLKVLLMNMNCSTCIIVLLSEGHFTHSK